MQGAAALVLAGLVGGKDNKEPRPRLRTQVRAAAVSGCDLGVAACLHLCDCCCFIPSCIRSLYLTVHTQV